MILFEERVWIIMSKDGKMIAKGVPRDRHLVSVDDNTDKKRILTYGSKGKAESGFRTSYFWGAGDYKPEDLEAVEVNMTMSNINI